MGVRITLEDMRAVGVCKKSKEWFNSHGFDFKDLRPINGGIDVDDLRATGSHLEEIERLESWALARTERAENGRQ